VLELGGFIAGPFAGQLLGDYGAEVIKLEAPPIGDVMRRWGICRDGQSLWWSAIARNKKSIVIDLHQLEGQRIARELASRSDIVIENFQPGKLREWGFDYETLFPLNPRIIIVHVSGFGQNGPRSKDPGFGSIGEAIGGIRFTTGHADRPPARTGISLGDSLAGLFAVIGALAAMREREVSGQGQEVDVAIYEAVFALMESTVADFELAGVTRGRSGGALPGIAPSNAYPTADGHEVVLAANADAVFPRLCHAMDQPELAKSELYCDHAARGQHSDEFDDEITRWTTSHDLAHVVAALKVNEVPYGAVNSAAEIARDPLFAARSMLIRLDAGLEAPIPMAGIVPKLSRTPGCVRWIGPSLGQHTDEVLTTILQLKRAEISRLRNFGAVQ
jgi:formyl-CoA transferase/succinyl-CoA--D-citramalate CoA-transferase